MKLPQDFREFLELFNAKGVEYMIVGSYERYRGRNSTLDTTPCVPRHSRLNFRIEMRSFSRACPWQRVLCPAGR